MNDLVFPSGGELITTSKVIADVFGKAHKDVIKAINNLECSGEFRERSYAPSFYMSPQNKKLKCFNVTRDGFSFLCMGFKGSKAAQWKEKYINAFNEMEKGLLNIDARLQQLEAAGKKIKESGQEWSAYGHEIRRMKKDHDKAINKLVSDVQFKLELE